MAKLETMVFSKEEHMMAPGSRCVKDFGQITILQMVS